MGLLGWAIAGGSGFGPSKLFESLPYKNWRELTTWVEEYIDAIGYRLDVLNQRFISPAARARLLDPTITPTDSATTYLATATAPALNSTSSDTVLDVLLAIALGLYPADSNLTVAQKQALVQVGWDALQRKGTRLRLLNLASTIADGVVLGWTVPPNNFSIILPDGAPDPGYGNWVQSNNSTAEVIRPWLLSAIRSTTKALTPDFVNLGVGYSQFRTGYSSTGETIFPANARTCILANEHFSSWTLGVPASWTKTGTATLTQSTSAPSINWEFTDSAAVLDLTATAIGNTVGLSQTTSLVNNQLTQRCQIDYAYTNTQNVSVLSVQVTDANPNGTTYYWNPTAATWSTAAYSIVIPPSAARARFAFDVVPQAASLTSTVAGTSSLTINIFARYDGTATTATTYTVYRVGLYDKFSLVTEQAAAGERTAWYPLEDAPCWTSALRSSSTAVLLEPANADRSAYKMVQSSTGVAFPYHAALTSRGYQSNSAWINVVKGSNNFGADWTLSNATRTANAQISPIVGETSASAVQLTATSTAAQISQTLGAGINPQNKTYVGGVWVKKLTSDASHVLIQLVSNNTATVDYTLTQSQGWQLLPIRAAFGAGDTTNLSFVVKWASASATAAIAVASAYVYDVTGKTKLLYPPIVQTPIGATATLNATTCQAVTQTTNTNVLHPLTQRALQSVVRGGLALTVVPVFDASSQPSQVIFDLAQGAAQNRVVLRVNAGALELRRWDNAGNQWVASLTLTTGSSPASGSMTWMRDTAITVRCLFDENTTMLSAANSNASGTKPGTWAPSDASVSKLLIGSDTSGANQFDGIITNVECLQLGAPVT
jgi:hypothetical protein